MPNEIMGSKSKNGSDSYVEWGAVFAGVVLAMAVSVVLLNFGAAIGFASASPAASDTGLKSVGVGAAFWLLLVTIWSFALGGYITGRLRHRWDDATESEVEFRDSVHGLLMWAVAVLLTAILATAGLASNGKGLRSVTASLTAENAAATSDILLRSDKPLPVGQLEDMRGEISRLLMHGDRNALSSPATRTYLSQLVSARTGLPHVEAETRVADTLDRLKVSTDRARKLAIVLGFLTASIVLIGGAVAWWAAAVGGAHRDQEILWHGFSKVTSLYIPSGWSK